MKQPTDHLRSLKKPVTKTVWIAGDSELADDLAAAREELRKIELRFQAQSPESHLRGELARASVEQDNLVNDLEAKLRESSIKFVLRGISKDRFNKLITSNQPTDQQIKEADETEEDKPPWNTDTYPQALIAACLMEPVFPTEEEKVAFVDMIFTSDDWNMPEQMAIFMAAVEVNQTRRNINLGKG